MLLQSMQRNPAERRTVRVPFITQNIKIYANYKQRRNRKLEKIMKNYWSISKIAGVLFTLWNYGMWTEPFNIVKAVLLIIGVSAGTFIVINVLDIVVGLIKKLCENINRHFKDKRLLKGFYMSESKEV